ncbi:MAG: hypothetical protein JWQ33_1184, partial [Ramlibacter sp.]|nr:hypothetical protein [Ramlibacter sp.]
VCAHWGTATAQKVNRCGDSYSNQPCAGATVVPTDDPRSAAQRAATEAATQRDAKSASTLEKLRLKQESQPAQATVPAPRLELPEPVAERPAAKRKLKKPELFTAVEPRKPGDAAAKNKKSSKAAKTVQA